MLLRMLRWAARHEARKSERYRPVCNIIVLRVLLSHHFNTNEKADTAAHSES
jgi:hypothetical protein